MADVFISYSRRDKDFVEVLHQALTKSQYDAWVDWQDIPLTADWWAEIQAGIDAADTFVFVISPDSVASPICGKEVDHAAANHKRLVPIVRRDGFDMAQMRPVLGQHNWLFFRQNDDFDSAFQALVTALQTDLEHVKTHTRLLVRAREWETQGRSTDFLLRGSDLEAAEDWLTASGSKLPLPSQLHHEYLGSARRAETLRQQQQRRRLQAFLAAVAGLAVVSLALAIFALAQRQEAVARRREALDQRARAYEQANLAFARQLAAEIEARDQGNLAGLQRLAQIGPETVVDLGLETLSPDKAALLRGLQPAKVVISKTGQFMAVLTRDRELFAWNLTSQAVVLETGPAVLLVDLDFSPDDRILTATTQSGELRIWKVGPSRYDLINTLKAHSSPLSDSAFSPNGRFLVTADRSGAAKIWDVSTLSAAAAQPIATLLHQGEVSSVVVSADEQYVISGSRDATVRVWSIDGQQLLCIPHLQPVWLVGLSSEDGALGSVSGNYRVRIWRWRDLLNQPDQIEGARSAC